MPDSVLSVLHELSHLIFTITLPGKHYYCFHFTDKGDNFKRLCDLSGKPRQLISEYLIMTYTTALDGLFVILITFTLKLLNM